MGVKVWVALEKCGCVLELFITIQGLWEINNKNNNINMKTKTTWRKKPAVKALPFYWENALLEQEEMAAHEEFSY